MAIDLATGFNIGSKDAIDERQILTLEQMRSLDESIYPDKYFAICKDNGKLYLYNVNNGVDNETGKFRVLEGNVIDGTTDDSAYTTVVFDKIIDMGKYFLLAKITNANYANNIIKFSCPNFKGQNDVGFKYEDDMDIYKFELHFNTGAIRETNGYGVTLKQHGLCLYSYPLNNPQNTSPEIKDAVRLYWDYSKGEIYVFLVDLMTAIPHCVLEYTGSGTLLSENTFINDDLYNRLDGANGTWGESKWKSIPYNKLETPPIYELGGDGGSGSAEGSTTYTSLTELGLTADATVEDVVNTLKNGESFLAPVNIFTNYETIFPNKLPNDQWNKIHIIKGTSLPNSHIRCYSQSGVCEYLANVNNTNIVSWNDVSGTYIDISDSIIEKLGTEILKYPVGKYRINSTTTGNKFTDLPSDAGTTCGLIEVNGTAVGKSPFTDTWVYRMYKFECLTGTLSYIRRLNSGATAGQIELDTGWCKEGQYIYTSLSELGLTAPVSVGEIFNAMPNKTMAVIACEDTTEHITDVPAHYGVLTIKKNTSARFSIDYQISLQSSPCNVKRWIGTLKGSDGTGLNWKQLSTEPTFVALNDIGLAADATFQDVIDKLPKGSSAILGVKEFTNYQTIFPYEEGNDQFARVHIVKGLEDGSCMYARWFRKDGVKEAIAKFNINDNKFNGWQRIPIGITKKTLAFNSNTFKIDITKGNENWNGNMKFGYDVDRSYGEIIISSMGKTEVLWDCSEGVRYVKSVTYTIDPNNNAHVTIGVELYHIAYGVHQLEMAGDFATINSFTGDAFTGTSVAKRGGTKGRNNGVGLLCEVEDLGLTFPCTTVQIVQAMRDLSNTANRMPSNSMIGIFNCGPKAETITDAPTDYGLLHVETNGHDRVSIRFDSISGSNHAGSWIGQIKGSNGTFNGITWCRIDNATRITTLETQVSELFQSVSDGKTLVANAITGKGVSTSTTATFATMATNIGKISGGYKEETKVLIVTSNTTGTEALTFTFSANVIAVKQIVAPSYEGYSNGTCYVVTSTSKNIFSINGKNLSLYVKGTGRWEVTALIQA